MAKRETMDSRNAICGAMADCQIIWNKKQYNFIQAIRLDARFEKIVKLNRRGHKVIEWRGTGRIVFHYNDSVLRRMQVQSKKLGVNIYFDMQVTNNDPTARMGRQTILLKDCCIESGTLARFDAGSDFLEDEMEFTFRDFEFLEQFQYQDKEAER